MLTKSFSRACHPRCPLAWNSPVVRLNPAYLGGRVQLKVNRHMADTPQGPGILARQAVPSVYTETDDPEIKAFQEHQKTAARPSYAEEARTLMSTATFGVLSTISAKAPTAGFPFGSVIEYAVDDSGRPFFATSTLSPHTADMAADGRMTLTVMVPGFKGVQDGRFSLQGVAAGVSGDDVTPLRAAYLTKYPGAFWVDFADFRWWRMDTPVSGRYVGGFGVARTVSAEDYIAARPDPIIKFSGPVCGHMNADHGEDTMAMVKHYAGLGVEAAKMLDLDRLGLNLEVTRKGNTFKLRLPFPRPVEDRKGIKEAIVEMTRAARAAAAPAAA